MCGQPALGVFDASHPALGVTQPTGGIPRAPATDGRAAAMLSAEERRRLDEIERLLQLDDPRFVARMRAEPRDRRRWVPLVFHGLLWLVALVVGAVVSWAAAALVAAFGTVVAVVVVAVRALRRRHRERWWG